MVFEMNVTRTLPIPSYQTDTSVILEKIDTDDFSEVMETMRNFNSYDWRQALSHGDDPLLLVSGLATSYLRWKQTGDSFEEWVNMSMYFQGIDEEISEWISDNLLMYDLTHCFWLKNDLNKTPLWCRSGCCNLHRSKGYLYPNEEAIE
tara:strand:- start:48 stop:491 length:444 start_codon:yes stop_codon:yes gene_type:complete